MRHVPHLHLPGSWEDPRLPVPPATRNHLNKVLRWESGSPVTYTDGAGRRGRGVWTGDAVDRGEEVSEPPPARRLAVAVAPPKGKDRQRSIVEKLQELGVTEMVWTTTERTQTRPPSAAKSTAWAVGALEQSTGAWLMAIRSSTLASVIDAATCPVSILDPDADDVLAWPDGASFAVVVGPEGGLTDDERSLAPAAHLGGAILRTDTAAVVAAALMVVR